jgi:hypothetical protein
MERLLQDEQATVERIKNVEAELDELKQLLITIKKEKCQFGVHETRDCGYDEWCIYCKKHF